MHRGSDLVRLYRRIAAVRVARDVGEHDRLRVGKFAVGVVVRLDLGRLRARRHDGLPGRLFDGVLRLLRFRRRARHQPIALGGAIDGWEDGFVRTPRAIETERAGDVVQAEAREANARRLRNLRADRLRHAEHRRVNGAEGRSDRGIAPARCGRLGRHDILIADLRRRDDVEENGETEGGNFRPPRPVTRRDHTQLTQRYAALTRTMMKPRCLRLTHRRTADD